MFYALNPLELAGDRILADPETSGLCPLCEEVLIPKCGELVSWHWAHRARLDCDPWSEPEGEWHLGWKRKVPANRVEVRRPPHRADIVTPVDRVVELQQSSISVQDIRARESFYGTMAWLFDVRHRVGEDGLDLRDHGRYWTFRWKHPRRSLVAVRQPLYLDADPWGILDVRRFTADGLCGGWGYRLSEGQFIARVLQEGW